MTTSDEAVLNGGNNPIHYDDDIGTADKNAGRGGAEEGVDKRN